jgi:hypothetical protein
MAEGESDHGHSHPVPPMTYQAVGSSGSAPGVELRDLKSEASPGMLRRLAVAIGLLLAHSRMKSSSNRPLRVWVTGEHRGGIVAFGQQLQ